MIENKKIILGISGGIAAYKSLSLIRLFIKAGAGVKVVLTDNAHWFVTKVSIESLSHNKVYDKVFGPENDYTTEHISLTDWGDCFVVAPATANIIGKYASGIADDALSTSLLAFDKQVIMAPAMNGKMYKHFSVQKNMRYLADNGVMFIEPASGFLACGYEGQGRMEEPETIFKAVSDYFTRELPLEGKKILVSAGPTQEALDPVRYLGNHSSGKMGFAIARQLAMRGAEVTLISGPVNLETPPGKINRINITTAEEMLNASLQYFPQMDGAVFSAAVADYRPETILSSKLKSSEDKLVIHLTRNPDILFELGRIKKPHQILVGFALETDNEQDHAFQKLEKKNLDFIVLNSLRDAGAGFGIDTNKITILDNKRNISGFELKTKEEAAADIIDKLQAYLQ